MRKPTTGAEYAATKYNEYRVTQEQTITEFLERELHGISRNRLKHMLAGRGVMVDRSVVTRHDHLLRPGQMVRVMKHRRKTELQSKHISIVYEDKDIVVVDKQPGILSAASSAKQYCVKTVLDAYFERRHFKCHAHVVHRLDRDTSGLLLYAKSIEAAQALQLDWKRSCYDRRYVAVVDGVVEQEGGTLTEPIDGKDAVTHFRVVGRGTDMTLCEMRLETGRTNQIRIHMAGIGHPVLGDAKYGCQRSPVGRLCLHAYRLYVVHPTTGERLEFETAKPTPFLRLFR